MLTKFYLTDGGKVPMEFGSSDELAKFKEIVVHIRNFLDDKEGTTTRSILLKQLENGQDINAIMGQLLAWKVPPEIAISDFQAVFNAIKNMLQTLENRELKYLQISTIAVGKEVSLDVKFIHPGEKTTIE